MLWQAVQERWHFSRKLFPPADAPATQMTRSVSTGITGSKEAGHFSGSPWLPSASTSTTSYVSSIPRGTSGETPVSFSPEDVYKRQVQHLSGQLKQGQLKLQRTDQQYRRPDPGLDRGNARKGISLPCFYGPGVRRPSNIVLHQKARRAPARIH